MPEHMGLQRVRHDWATELTERESGARECAGGDQLKAHRSGWGPHLAAVRRPGGLGLQRQRLCKGGGGGTSAGGAAVRGPEDPRGAAGVISLSVPLYFPVPGSCSVKNLPTNLSCSKCAFATNNPSTLSKNIYVLL